MRTSSAQEGNGVSREQKAEYVKEEETGNVRNAAERLRTMTTQERPRGMAKRSFLVKLT